MSVLDEPFDAWEARLQARLDAHFAKFAPAIAAINAGFRTSVLQPAASSSEIERSGGGFRTVLEDIAGAPTCGNDGARANPSDQSRTADVANLVTATSERNE